MVRDCQEVYINMDDSGVFHSNERCCIYGGIVFVGKNNQDNFGRKYKKIINQINCCYCNRKKDNCNHRCPEIKDTNIFSNHKRWLFNMIKKEECFAVIINNAKIHKNIMDDKDSRGRYRDYAQRRVIKKVIISLINQGKLNPNLPVKLILRIDQQGTSTNTNRAFVDDIVKELKEGIVNLEYNKIYKPIIFADLTVDLMYVLSHRHVSIQAADFIAGETRRTILSNINNLEILKKLDFLNIKLFLP